MLRDYRGETYRVINDRTGDIAAKYTPGNIMRHQDFLSTSRSPSPSYQPFASARSGQTRFIIQSKSGKLVENISEYTAEREVLFRSGTKFKVTSKTYNTARGTWDITLTEI
jgi:hypothetical protein